MAGTQSFKLHGTDPEASAYGVLTEFNDGYMQNLPPAISALEQIAQVLNQYVAGNYTLNSTTGIFSVGSSYHFQPSWLIEAIPPADETWYNANKDVNGTAFKVIDCNSDNTDDLIIYTPDGKQVLYTVI